MTTDDIQLLFEYDRWANHRVVQAASNFSTEEFTRDLGGAFSSIRETLVHIIAGEWVWLEYWENPLARLRLLGHFENSTRVAV
jgi:uncharacterized damage-inducible protein DinB